MAKLSLFSVMSTVHTVVHTWLRGKRVGADEAGNVYYTGRPRGGKQRRWVVYAGRPDASAVPPQWHGWLHHQTDELPENAARFRKPWQKPHQPNLTGTPGAHLPAGHPAREGRRPTATGDYIPWRPLDN